MTEFEDIKIVAMDDDASHPSGRGALMSIVLRLSETAPPKWADLFNLAWRQHFTMMKRNAHAFGDTIEVECMPDEVQGLVNEFKTVIDQVNEQYRKMLGLAEQRMEARKNKEAEERQALRDLKGKLKFD